MLITETEKLRILVVAPSAYRLGGIATWLNYWLPGMRSMGWDITLGLTSGGKYHRPAQYLSLHPDPQSIEIHCRTGSSAERVDAVRQAIRKSNADVVLSVNVPDAIVAAGREKSKRPLRAVMTCHGIQDELFADMRTLAPILDAVICTNRLASALASEIGKLPSDRIFHAPYGTDVPDSLPSPPANPRFTIAYSGRLEQPQKRIHDLPEIAKHLRSSNLDFRFLIAGAGPEEAALKSSLTESSLIQHFEFLGHIPADQLNEKLYRAADALLVPSLWETGPIVIWEAMAAGLPVVSSRYIGSGREGLLQHDSNCLLFDVSHCEEAARQLQNLAGDMDLKNRLRTTAFAFARAALSHSASVQNWHNVMLRICASPVELSFATPTIRLASSGRLDHLLGWRAAALTRRLVGRLPMDRGAAGEWPHSLQRSHMPPKQFWDLARELDQESLPLINAGHTSRAGR